MTLNTTKWIPHQLFLSNFLLSKFFFFSPLLNLWNVTCTANLNHVVFLWHCPHRQYVWLLFTLRGSTQVQQLNVTSTTTACFSSSSHSCIMAGLHTNFKGAYHHRLYRSLWILRLLRQQQQFGFILSATNYLSIANIRTFPSHYWADNLLVRYIAHSCFLGLMWW